MHSVALSEESNRKQAALCTNLVFINEGLVRCWHFSDLTTRTGSVRSLVQSGLRRFGSSICQGVQSKPPPDPDVADTAPSDSVLTVYDQEHVITYLRLLDADAEGADWREVARIVLHLDPGQETD